jgi:hypothetical protein
MTINSDIVRKINEEYSMSYQYLILAGHRTA